MDISGALQAEKFEIEDDLCAAQLPNGKTRELKITKIEVE